MQESALEHVSCDGGRVDVVKHKMDHLSCFIPAMLALGAHAGAVTGAKADKYLQVHFFWQDDLVSVSKFLCDCLDVMLGANVESQP